MKERTTTSHDTRSSDEPWPAIEAQWPNARWMSPWAFQDPHRSIDDAFDEERSDPVHARH